MQFISFNINGVRAHEKQVLFIMRSIYPEIIGLQEIKTQEEYFPEKKFLQYGYRAHVYGQKQYHGVAFLSRIKIQKTFRGLYNYDNRQRRVIAIELKTKKIKKLIVINIYAPHGESFYKTDKFEEKKFFYQKLYLFLKRNCEKNAHILIMGDMNISPTDLDIGLSVNSYKQWLNLKKCAFLPEERMWLNNLFQLGFKDVFRYLYPQKKNFYSWFDYRSQGYLKNIGLRIDLFLATHNILKYIQSSGILYHIRLIHTASDHVPIWIKMNI
ncbi:exonuclease III [Wigglesworthia glossinidia endosymbiont of Glossina morsitans morsitans (Yale colony)]|uniref:Exonuclease III n=1 Tax=Wigglesworthia glossinidia endosymbiont of Glossina morsitans morsitans (Yale colony) TaxID=1142511 RepID=H6Q4U4_WIGGL|nr:exodeoxyribonuclease III [Wigglesworthia glossinidia]AFA41227.1 exonuclease III [Wigglesworthia glossinidia endosymbiont of Glossina morsitans morsitans (Yale colony)]